MAGFKTMSLLFKEQRQKESRMGFCDLSDSLRSNQQTRSFFKRDYYLLPPYNFNKYQNKPGTRRVPVATSVHDDADADASIDE